MKNSEKKQELKNMVADLCAADAIATLEKNGCKIVVEKAHKVCYFGGERIGQIDSWYKKATRDNADGETKQPKKATRRGRKVTATAPALNVTRLALDYVNDLNKLFSDRAATKTNQAAEAVTALTAALRSGLYTAAADYLKKSLSEAKTAAATFDRAADIVNRADAIYHRYIDFNLYQAENRRACRAYDEQAAILTECETEAERDTMIKVLRRAGKYIETAPAPFARPVCEGLQAVTAADLTTAETAATFAAADRERAAADLAATLADAVYCNNLAARLETTAAELRDMLTPFAAPTPAADEVAKTILTATPAARKGRAKKTA